jgi:transcriptional regulator with XRE-family HTH domain
MTDEQKLHDAEIRQRIGARVFFLRKSRKMTALTLAEKTGLHRNTIYRIEAALSLCSIGQIWRIAIALGVGVEDFLCDSPSSVHRPIEEKKPC